MPSATIHTKTIPSPLGQLQACATAQGVCMLHFMDTEYPKKQMQSLITELQAEIKEDLTGENEHLTLLEAELGLYFEGKLREFKVALHLVGTDFQQSVWHNLLEIPYGNTISYKTQSEQMQNPLGIRAIANANGKNKIGIVVPCHRVIGSSGKLVGYAGGEWRKKKLLMLEMADEEFKLR